jgi:hypothetical protein
MTASGDVGSNDSARHHLFNVAAEGRFVTALGANQKADAFLGGPGFQNDLGSVELSGPLAEEVQRTRGVQRVRPVDLLPGDLTY